MKAVLVRPALLAALALALGACTEDRPLAPAPPSFAGATPVFEEPTPIPDTTSTCMRFDGLAVGTRWGASAGTPKGPFVHSDNNIRMSLRDYIATTGAAQYGHAVIDTARYDVLVKHALRLDSIGVVFDFTAIPFTIGKVTFYFVDRSPMENLELDGGGIDMAQVSDWPSLWMSVGSRVKIFPRPYWPARGQVQISGDLDTVRVGGSNDPGGDVTGLWLDTVCVFKAPLLGQQEEPTPP